jgi:uncharacterized membrane protein
LKTPDTNELEKLPVVDGFRMRGAEMTRLETFADAAFAFAVTLLVVGGGDAIPSSFEEMTRALKQVPAFAASFANITFFWYAHHRWSRRFGLENAGAVVLSLLLVFVVLIYVYPLKAIYSGAFQFFSGGYLESYFTMRSIDDLRSMFVIFGTAYAGLSFVILLLNRHALEKRAELGLNDREVFDTVSEMQHWMINMAVPALSIILALLLPDSLLVIAGLIYGLFGAAMPWHSKRRAKLRGN